MLYMDLARHFNDLVVSHDKDSFVAFASVVACTTGKAAERGQHAILRAETKARNADRVVARRDALDRVQMNGEWVGPQYRVRVVA